MHSRPILSMDNILSAKFSIYNHQLIQCYKHYCISESCSFICSTLVGKTTGVCHMEYSHQETCCGSWRHSCIHWTVRRLTRSSSSAGRWSTFVSLRRSIEVCLLPCSEGQRCINRIPLLKNSIYLKIRCSKTMCTFLSSTAVSSDLYQCTTTFSLRLSSSFLSCPPFTSEAHIGPKPQLLNPF